MIPPPYRPTRMDRTIWWEISECASTVNRAVRCIEEELSQACANEAEEIAKAHAALAVLRPIMQKLFDSEGM